MEKIKVEDLGFVSYAEALDFQRNIFKEYLAAKKNGQFYNDVLILCEHPHVYTSGKSGNSDNLLITNDKLREIGAEFFPVERGGDITYHGPGQLVVYPIIDLEKYGMGVKDYIYFLEFLVIDILKDYGIRGEISEGNIGVWIDTGKANERKICSIGVKTGKGITMHGFALNVNTDLSYFDYINPCGFTNKGVTSVKNEVFKEVDFNEVKKSTAKEFVKRLRK